MAMRTVLMLMLAFVLAGAGEAHGQKRPGRRRGQDVQTPENALDKERANRESKEAEYRMRRDHQAEIQDKSTRKRMKKNLKKAQKQSWGKSVPWYKRVFRRRKF